MLRRSLSVGNDHRDGELVSFVHARPTTLRGISGDATPRLDVARRHGARGDHGAFADTDARADERLGGDPGAAADDDRRGDEREVGALVVVARRAEKGALADDGGLFELDAVDVVASSTARGEAGVPAPSFSSLMARGCASRDRHARRARPRRPTASTASAATHAGAAAKAGTGPPKRVRPERARNNVGDARRGAARQRAARRPDIGHVRRTVGGGSPPCSNQA